MMGNEIEAFACEILHTEYMLNLLFHSDGVEKHKKEIELLENWEKFKSIEEIKQIDNKHIQNAIKELEQKNKK